MQEVYEPALESKRSLLSSIKSESRPLLSAAGSALAAPLDSSVSQRLQQLEAQREEQLEHDARRQHLGDPQSRGCRCRRGISSAVLPDELGGDRRPVRVASTPVELDFLQVEKI